MKMPGKKKMGSLRKAYGKSSAGAKAKVASKIGTMPMGAMMGRPVAGKMARKMGQGPKPGLMPMSGKMPKKGGMMPKVSPAMNKLRMAIQKRNAK